MSYFFPKEYKALTRLGLPIMVGQIGLTFQNLADNIMVGQHSTEELAAVGFVNSMFLLGLLLTIGFSIGSVSQIGAFYAQGNDRRIVEILKSSIVANMLQGALIVLALVGLYFALPYMGQPEELIPLMKPYLVIQILSLPFMVSAGAFKQCCDSINDTSVGMITMLIGNVWNIVFNWLLIFGHWGFPEMGIEGAAWATASSRVLILILTAAVFFLRPKYKKYVKLWHTCKSSMKDVLLLNRLGWPIAIQMGLETASFTLVTIFLGWMGTNVLAANQVMLSLTNFIFMFYIGVSNAVTIRVSNYNGLNDIQGVRNAAFAGWQMIFVLGVILSIIAFSLRNYISLLFTDNAEVAAIVAVLAYPLVLYQLGDGTQVTFANALRGLGDVKMLIPYSFFAYIVISLPMSYIMGITLDWGALGVWMAFPFGLSIAAVLYLRRFLKVTSKTLSQG
ncbi:MAG: MATE family efflux transporter [Muribaculaceae bacterium]|nr:MATE family efflux transporter [Muribaculaceae bacterium]